MSGSYPTDIIAAARASQAKWDVPASVCLAQWALESGWGRSMPRGSNNPFGIKAAPGQPFVTAMTREVLRGRSTRLPQRFRKFADLAEAFEAHGRLLATGAAYAAARAVRRDPKAFAHALQGHYATDPNYAAELIGLMDRDDLYRHDTLASDDRNTIEGVQAALNRLGTRPALLVDGVLGARTRDAIRVFQARHGLFQDGQATAAVVAAIAAAPPA